MRKEIRWFLLFFSSFYVLNIVNTYFVTSATLNRYLVSFERGFFSELNAILGNIAALTILLVIVFLIFKKPRLRLIATIILTGFLNFGIYSLGIFTRYYSSMFSLHTLSVFRNPAAELGFSILIEAAKELVTYYRIVVFIPTFALIAIYLIMKRQMRRESLSFETMFLTSFRYARATLITGAIILSGITLQFFRISLERNWLLNTEVSLYGSQYAGMYNYYLVEMMGVNFTHQPDLDDWDPHTLHERLAMYNKNKPLYENAIDGKTYTFEDEFTGLFAGKNLMLIHVESLNHFVLGLQHPDGGPLMPNLHDMLSQSAVFDQMYASVGQGNSADAEFSVTTGLYANGYSTINWDYEDIPYEFPTLATYLSAEGYRTFSLHGDTELFYNRRNFHQNVLGFEYHYATEDYPYTPDTHPDHFVGPWVSDEKLFDWTFEIAHELQAQNESFFLFPIMITPHTPYLYNPFDPLDWDESIESSLMLRYLNYLHYTDYIFGYFMELTKTLEDTVYVFYSDHGSGFNEGSLEQIGLDLDRLETRLALQHLVAWIYDPSGTLEPQEISLVRAQVDLYRTMMNLWGITPDPRDFIPGVNALSQEPTYAIDPRNLDIVTDRFFVSGKRPNEYIAFEDDVTKEEVYDFVVAAKAFKQRNDKIVTWNLIKRLRELEVDDIIQSA